MIEEYTVEMYLHAEGLTATPTLFAASDTHLTNRLHVSGEQADVVVDGDVTCTAQTRVDGDLIASGDVRLTNTCTVGGDVLAGGSVTLSARPVVHGSVTAVGDVRMQSTATVHGDVLAGGTVASTDGRSINQLIAGGSIGGDVIQGAQVAAPVLPVPAAADVLSAPGYDELTWTGWLNAVAAANAAPGWSRGLTASPGCVMGPWASSVNGSTVTVTAPTRVDARRLASGCSLTSLQGMTLRLGADLVLVADNWRVTNGLRVESVDGAVHTLHVVVPGELGAGPGDLTVTNGIEADDPSVVRLVAPGSVRVNGPSEFGGSITGGSVSVTGTVELRWPAR